MFKVVIVVKFVVIFMVFIVSQQFFFLIFTHLVTNHRHTTGKKSAFGAGSRG